MGLRALHVFPLFGPDLNGGAERYEFMLCRKLAELGVEVEVFTTCAARVRFGSSFGLRWQTDYPPSTEYLAGMKIQRFASWSLPDFLGRAVSRAVMARWRREERRWGAMLQGSAQLPDYYHACAMERPGLYDWTTLAARGPFSAGLIRALARAIGACDVVLAGFMPFAVLWQVSRMARWWRKPLVILALFHPEDRYHHFKAFYRCFAQADAVLTQTAWSTALLKRLIPGCRAVEVGAGVEREEFANPHISGARFRARHGLERKRIVLYVGRKEFSKRYDLAVQAADLIDDERIRLVMIGQDVDHVPVTSHNVTYLGAVSPTELLDAYDACDVFILPSEQESFGIVFLEAWMRGKPVLGNRLCGASGAVIRDGMDGFLCAGAVEFAQRIVQLLRAPELAAAMGRAGQRKTLERFTWDAVAGRVEGVYRGLSPGASAPAAPRQRVA